MRARIQSFVEERNAVMFSLDRERIERYMKKRGIAIPSDDTVFWAGIYKGICNITDAPPELVAKAQAWLIEHRMSPHITL